MTTYESLLKNPDFKKKSVLETLIKEYTHLTREEIWIHLNDPIDEKTLQLILDGYHQYIEDKKPLEYIVGHVDFFGKEFYVNEHTIIPRPETEYMVRAVSNWISIDTSKQQKKTYTLLDIGTGSGILGISVLLQNPDTFNQVFLSDISEEALEVAKKNWERLIKNYQGEKQFLKSNLADFLTNEKEETSNHIILVANLPYIPDETFDNNALENVQKREPRLAFVGGDDGLDLYREMFEQIATRDAKHNTHKVPITMFLEMMTRQIEILKKEFDRLEFEELETFHFNIKIVKVQQKN